MREVAQLVVPELRWSSATGHELLRPAIDRALAAGVGGFLLRGGPRERVRALARELHARSTVPLLVAADLERGAGQQFGGAVGLPPPAALATLPEPEAVRRAARMTALEALSLGVNWNLAPVCDLDFAAASLVVGTRAYGADPARTAELAAEAVDATQATAMLACAKHFPGHGRAAGDSHRELPVVDAATDTLYEEDLVPFRAAIDAGVASIMTAHVAYPALDPSGVPATLSHPILVDLLRDALGFEGLVVSDRLTMRGVLGAGGEAAAAVHALAAGCDLLLAPEDPAAVIRAIEAALLAGRLSEEALHHALHRRTQWAQWTGAPRATDGATDADVQWSAIAAVRVVHVVRGAAAPLTAPVDVLIVEDGGDDEEGATPPRRVLIDALAAGGVEPNVTDAPASGSRGTVLVALFGDGMVEGGRAGYSAAARAAVERACSAARAAYRTSVVVQFGHPRLAAGLTAAPVVVCAWSGEKVMQQAAARWLTRGSR